jgi:hypothetical protein
VKAEALIMEQGRAANSNDEDDEELYDERLLGLEVRSFSALSPLCRSLAYQSLISMCAAARAFRA